MALSAITPHLGLHDRADKTPADAVRNRRALEVPLRGAMLDLHWIHSLRVEAGASQ